MGYVGQTVENVNFGGGDIISPPRKSKEVLLDYYFRVSEFDQFIDKMNQVNYTNSGGASAIVVHQNMNGGTLDLLEEYGSGNFSPLVQRTITSDVFEAVKKDIINPFKLYLDREYITEELLEAYYDFASIEQISSNEPSPQDLFVADFSTDSSPSGQVINIDQEINAKSKYSSFRSNLRKVVKSQIDVMNENAEIFMYNNGNVTVHEHCLSETDGMPYGAIEQIYNSCVREYFEDWDIVQFINKFEPLMNLSYPSWKLGTDKMRIDMRYILPNDNYGGHYVKTVKP